MYARGAFRDLSRQQQQSWTARLTCAFAKTTAAVLGLKNPLITQRSQVQILPPLQKKCRSEALSPLIGDGASAVMAAGCQQRRLCQTDPNGQDQGLCGTAGELVSALSEELGEHARRATGLLSAQAPRGHQLQELQRCSPRCAAPAPGAQ